MNRFKATQFLILLFLASTSVAQETPSLDFETFSQEIHGKGETRLIRLTAHLTTKNKSKTPIDRYIYRLTVPPNTQAQRCFLESSTSPVFEQKTHRNNCNDYVVFEYPVEPNATHVIDVNFLVLVRPVNFLKAKSITPYAELVDDERERWVKPSKLIESESKEILAAADKVFANCKDIPPMLAKSAYEFPRQALKFKLQKKSLGAQKALSTGIGDCTEHACLFAALCRTKDIPARKISVFNFSKKSKISKKTPNHHIAEFYLDSHGWVPVDANLGNKQNSRPVGFGKLSNYFVTYNREGAWVWQTYLPKNGYDKKLVKPKLGYAISWDGEVVQEGSFEDMKQAYVEYYQDSHAK